MSDGRNSMEIEKEVLEAHIKKKSMENGLFSVLRADEKEAYGKGENYCSVIYKYRLEIVLGSGEKCIRNYLIKKMPSSESQTTFFHKYSFYSNEINMYAKVLRMMDALMEEFEDRREKLWCEMITCRPYQMLVLEDLQDQDFRVMNRRKCLDFDHSILVLRALGRFHAMSKVMITKRMITKDEMSQYLFTHEFIAKILFESSLNVLIEAVKKHWGEKWAHLPEKLMKAIKKTCGILLELAQLDESRFNVMNHGDCWTNNMLFKHVEGTDIPCAVKFIDFQASHYNSYAWDVTYFLYNATLPHVRRTRYLELISAYQQSLASNLKYYNYKNNDVPTLEAVKNEMERLKYFGFLLVTSIHAMTTADMSNAFDMEVALNNPNNPGIAHNIDMFTDVKYRERVGEDFVNFINEKLL